MAKQTGIHGLKGKVNGMSYYSSKNGGSLVRKINDGLGQRVKSSREYSNTRKNNAEFGACGDFAGSFIGIITSRWRFILNSIATGMMVKAAKAAIVRDTTNPWGQREIPAAQFAALYSTFNGLSKNAMPEAIVDGFNANLKYVTGTSSLTAKADIQVDADLAQHLADIGADGFMVDTYRLEIEMPLFTTSANAYSKAVAHLEHLESLSIDLSTPPVGDTILAQGDAQACDDFDQTDVTFLSVAFVLFRPYRTIGGEKSVLQQHCAGWVYVPETVSA